MSDYDEEDNYDEFEDDSQPKFRQSLAEKSGKRMSTNQNAKNSNGTGYSNQFSDPYESKVYKKDTVSSVKSNAMEYRESEVDEDLAFKYYQKKMGYAKPAVLQEEQEIDQDEYYSDQEFEQPAVNKKGVSFNQQNLAPISQDEADKSSSAGRGEKIIGLDDSSDEENNDDDDEPVKPNIRNNRNSPIDEDEYEDNEYEEENHNFSKPKNHDVPRATFGIAGGVSVNENLQKQVQALPVQPKGLLKNQSDDEDDESEEHHNNLNYNVNVFKHNSNMDLNDEEFENQNNIFMNKNSDHSGDTNKTNKFQKFNKSSPNESAVFNKKANQDLYEDNEFESLKDIDDLKNAQIQQQNNAPDSDDYKEDQEQELEEQESEERPHSKRNSAQPYGSERDQYDNNYQDKYNDQYEDDNNFSDNGIKFIDAQGGAPLQYDEAEFEEQDGPDPQKDPEFFHEEEPDSDRAGFQDKYQESQGYQEEGESNDNRALQESDEDEEILKKINANKNSVKMEKTENEDEDYGGFEDQDNAVNSEDHYQQEDPPNRQSEQQNSSIDNGYEKKFTEKIIGLDSEDESSKDKRKSESNEDQNDPQYIEPPPDDDAPIGGDEYFDQDEEYLENESEHNENQSHDQAQSSEIKDGYGIDQENQSDNFKQQDLEEAEDDAEEEHHEEFIEDQENESANDAPSENNEYEEDEFEDENALGIQNLDDEDNDYDDEQFEQCFDDAEDLRRHQTASSKRPVSK